MHFQKSVEEYLLDQKLRGNSAHTIAYYKRVLHLYGVFEQPVDTDDITLVSCKRFHSRLLDCALVSTSVQTYIRGFRAYLAWLYQNGYHKEDLSRRFRLPKAQKKIIDVLTDQELQILVNAFPATYYGRRNLAICALMFDSGLRLHEVVTLTNDTLHLPERYAIVNGKGNKQRVVPIGHATAEILQSYLAQIPRQSGAVFRKEDGTPITDHTVKNIFRKLRIKTGIVRLHPHLLRHTFATRYLENGGDIYSLQAILGHSSLEMVKRYLHLATTRIRSNFDKFSPFDTLKVDTMIFCG